MEMTRFVSWKDGSENLKLHRDMMHTLKTGVGRIPQNETSTVSFGFKENNKNVWPMEGEVTFAYFKEAFDRYPTRRKIQAKVVFHLVLLYPRRKKKKKTTTKKKPTKGQTQDSDNNDNDNNNNNNREQKETRSKRVKEKNNAKNIYTEFDGVGIHSSTKWRSKIRLLEVKTSIGIS